MKCPGQDTRFWTESAVFEAPCPKCGSIVEFFKDDTARKCSKCQHRFVNPKMDFGCAAYCQFAEQCLGTLPEGLESKREDLFKERLAVEVKKLFKKDFKAIGRAVRRAGFVEEVGKATSSKLSSLLPAAYLYEADVSAKEFMLKLKPLEELAQRVEALIKSVAAKTDDNTLEYKVLFDAVLSEELGDSEVNGEDAGFLTQEGRMLFNKK